MPVCLSFQRATGSSSRPAMRRMTVRQTDLRVTEMMGSRSWPIYLGLHVSSENDSYYVITYNASEHEYYL